MDTKEREVVHITDRTDDTNAGVNLLLALVLGALIVFLVYLVSTTAISTWYPQQNTEYKIESTTTNLQPPVPATGNAVTQSESTTTTTTESAAPAPAETNSNE